LCRLMVTPQKGNFARLGGHADPGYLPSVHQVCRTLEALGIEGVHRTELSAV
jgi:hypothetical protein